MVYHYETLNHQQFQQLCQALIVPQFPNTQCLPVEQPDGGRDAFSINTEFENDGFTVFQVKFSKNPSRKNARESIKDAIQSEKEKVEELIQRGATQYVLITNVKGTAHLDKGSIDRLNQYLSNEISISSQVWWRDDVDRRLDNFPDVKWSYPEILKATDILPLLVKSHLDPGINKVTRAITNYMAMQYEKDKDVKFKQVDLTRNLTNLFVDLPIGHKQPTAGPRRSFRIDFNEFDEVSAYINLLDIDEEYESQQESPFGHTMLTGAFLVNMPPGKGVSRFVVEGAPGQGKSTVTQFVCQVNRMRLLDKSDELNVIDDAHKNGIVRTPFRLDMRDFADWVSYRDPFTNSSWANWRTDGLSSLVTSLESFLVRQVEFLSGGSQISTDDLLRFFTLSHSLIVLDGFDEVADLETRERIVDEICEAALRLNQHAKSMQIIVTSRPAAFSNSPGFPEDDWNHLELKDLQKENIEAFRDKWVKVQDLDEEENKQVSSILEDRIEQPYLRDLARNPMQLTILLHLIHVQGVALPDKRTKLYEEYMNLFFNREAEKSMVVQKHRELLLSIHGVLAWVLHTRVENGLGSGSVTKAKLISRLQAYLKREEHDAYLVQDLFQGTVERVGVIVSRKEGMYEFEVQPLREYFAARHLYKTAPYSPVGYAQKGTKLDRFEALARNNFWTNVTRFFCGFYDQGELGSLVDGITSLAESNGYNLINQPRNLAMMLLSDHVFTQAPKAMKRLVRFITEEPGFQRFTSMKIPRRYSYQKFRLSSDVGGKFLFEVCMEKLNTEDDPARCRGLRLVIAENATYDERNKLKSNWISQISDGLLTLEFLDEAIEFGIIRNFNPKQIATLASHVVDCHLRWLVLAHEYEAIEDESNLRLAAKKAFFNGEIDFPLRWFNINKSLTTLEVITEILRPNAFVKILRSNAKSIALNVIVRHINYYAPSKFLKKLNQWSEIDGTDSLDAFGIFSVKLLRKDVNEWQTSLECWSKLVDHGLDEAPGSYRMVQIAAISTATKAKLSAGTWDENGFSPTKGIVKRLFFARHKSGDINWWQENLSDINSESVCLYLSVLLSWGEPCALASLMARIDPRVNRLAPDQWSRLWELTCYISRAAPECRATITEDWFQNFRTLSPRMALILIERVNEAEVVRQLSRTYLSNYTGEHSEILIRATHNAFKGANDESIDWEYIKNLSSRMRQLDIREYISIPRQFSLKVPTNVAEDVLSNSEHYQEQFVAVCEESYVASVAQKAPKLSELNWFTPSD